jgi:hypothetical protein
MHDPPWLQRRPRGLQDAGVAYDGVERASLIRAVE